MPDHNSEIIQMAFEMGADFSGMLSENKNNRFFGLIIADDYPLFEEAFLVGCYKNHMKSDLAAEPEKDQKSRMDLFIDLINEHGKRKHLTISYRGEGKECVYEFDLCEIDRERNRLQIYKEPKSDRENKLTKWKKTGCNPAKKPTFDFRPIEIGNDPEKSNVLDYYLTVDVANQLNDERYKRLGLVERSFTQIYHHLELPQPGTTGAKDETILVKGPKKDTLWLWKSHGYWKNPDSGKLELGKTERRTNPISLAKLFNCVTDRIPDAPITSEFGQIVFSANINRDICNKKIIILNGPEAFGKIDYLKTSYASGVVLIVSMNDIFKFGLEKFREKLRNHLAPFHHRFHASSRISSKSGFKSKIMFWAVNPHDLILEDAELPETCDLGLTVNLIAPNAEKTGGLPGFGKVIGNLLKRYQHQGRDGNRFIWAIYNRLFRGGSYDIGNLQCYSEFQNKLGETFAEWEAAWRSKGAHPYNELIQNLPVPDEGRPYGMLTKYHGSPVKGCDDIAATVFKQIRKQDLVFISSQEDLKSHQGALLVLGKAPENFLEKIKKSDFSGAVYQIALHDHCNLKNQADNLNNLACLDNCDDSPNWSLPISIRSIAMEEQLIPDQPSNTPTNDVIGSGVGFPPSLDESDYGENPEEIDIADYFEKTSGNFTNQNDDPENVFTSFNNEKHTVSSEQVTYYSEDGNGVFGLKFGTPKVGDIAILPNDEKALKQLVMDLDNKFNLAFWQDNDLWKRALQNWIKKCKMTGVLDFVHDKFNKANINFYKNIDRTAPGAPDNKSDFEYLIANIKAYGLHDFGGAERMRNFDADSHWSKICIKRNIHRCIGRDFYEIIHGELSRGIKMIPYPPCDIQVNLFKEINSIFTVVKIGEITSTGEQE